MFPLFWDLQFFIDVGPFWEGLGKGWGGFAQGLGRVWEGIGEVWGSFGENLGRSHWPKRGTAGGSRAALRRPIAGGAGRAKF